jgi:hypothetical protein
MGCGGSHEASEEELAMRKDVMMAAKANDLAAMRKAIEALDTAFSDSARTEKAFGMWDPEDGTYATGDNPEINDKEGAGMRFMMPLKWAAYHGNVEMCKLIVERGGEVKSSCYFASWNRGKFMPTGGVPALSVAAMGNDLATVKYLVEEAGADPSYVDDSRSTAADHAGKQGNSAVQAYLWSKMKYKASPSACARVYKLAAIDGVDLCPTLLDGGGKLAPPRTEVLIADHILRAHHMKLVGGAGNTSTE